VNSEAGTIRDRARVALGIRNTHGMKRNLAYSVFQRLAQLKANIAPSAEQRAQAGQLRRHGVAKLGVLNVDQLAEIVEEKLSDVPFIHGYAQLPRRHNPLIAPYLFRILQEKGGAIEAFYSSHYRVNWFEVQKIAPGEKAAGSSFEYHTDDTPLPIIKLFVYLSDTYESNGAFRAFDYARTDELLRRGMYASSSPGERRTRAQALVPPSWEQYLTVVEGVKGTVFIFDNNLIHKGTLPRQGTRTHVSVEIMPSATPQTLEHLLKDCDKEIVRYFPTNPFRPFSAT
jgi:hypothetical protein